LGNLLGNTLPGAGNWALGGIFIRAIAAAYSYYFFLNLSAKPLLSSKIHREAKTRMFEGPKIINLRAGKIFCLAHFSFLQALKLLVCTST
jgi:hypothetical protein